jgi:hypothetical protein
MPVDHRTAAGVRQLLSEAGELCRHAEGLLLEEPEKLAIQRLYGPATADARIAFAFRGALSGPIRNWLRRAEQMLRTMKANSDIVGTAASTDLPNQLRHLVDCANAAMLTRSRSHHMWAAFHSAADGKTGASGPSRDDTDTEHVRGPGRVRAIGERGMTSRRPVIASGAKQSPSRYARRWRLPRRFAPNTKPRSAPSSWRGLAPP